MAETPTLQPYLPRLVLDWPRSTPEVLGRELEGSTVFVDVSGFTKMSERLARQGKVGAEEVSDVIGNTFGALLAEAYAYGGSLVKFGGDALLLFFEGDGHPHRAPPPRHTECAPRCAGSARSSTTAGKVTLRMSVGAHIGPVPLLPRRRLAPGADRRGPGRNGDGRDGGSGLGRADPAQPGARGGAAARATRTVARAGGPPRGATSRARAPRDRPDARHDRPHPIRPGRAARDAGSRRASSPSTAR